MPNDYSMTRAAHQSSVTSSAFSPCGRFLATGGEDGAAKLWSVKDCELHCDLHVNANRVADVSWMHDGQQLALSLTDRIPAYSSLANSQASFHADPRTNHLFEQRHTIRVIDVERSIIVAETTSGGETVDVSPNDNSVVFPIAQDVRIWKDEFVSTCELPRRSAPPSSVFYSLDGKKIACMYHDFVVVVDVSTREVSSFLTNHNNCDGLDNFIGSIRFWREKLREFMPSRLSSWAIESQRAVFCKKGPFVAFVYGSSIVVFDYSTFECISRWTDPEQREIRTATFSPDGLYLAVGGDNQRPVILDPASGHLLFHLCREPVAINSIVSTARFSLLAAGDSRGVCTLLDTNHTIRSQFKSIDDFSLNRVKSSPCGNILAFANSCGTVHLFQADDLTEVNTIHLQMTVLIDLFLFDSSTLVCVGLKGNTPHVGVWRVSDGSIALLESLPNGFNVADVVQIDRSLIACASREEVIRVHVSSTIEFQPLLRSNQIKIKRLHYLGGNVLLLADEGYSMALVDYFKETVSSRFNAVCAGPASFSACWGSRFLARGSHCDNLIEIFDLPSGDLVRLLEGHNNSVSSIARLGIEMATASKDGTIALWDTSTFERTGSVIL